LSPSGDGSTENKNKDERLRGVDSFHSDKMWHLTKCPGSTSTIGGSYLMHLSVHSLHLGWK